MSDDKTLELLIKLGVMGKEDAQALNDLLAEAQTGTGKLAETEKEASNETERGLFVTAKERQLTRIISAAERLKHIQEISAAETAAHLKRLEELDRESIAWMRSHGASPEAIALAEEARRRELDAAKDAAAHPSIDQRQSNFDAAAQAENERVARADAALKQANLDKQGATDALSGTAPGEKNSEARQRALDSAKSENERNQEAPDAANYAVTNTAQEKTVAEAARVRVESAGKENAGRLTTGTEEVRTKTAVQSQIERDQAAEDILRAQAGRLPYAFEQLATVTGKTHAQIETILNQLLDYHANTNEVLNALAGRLAQLIAEHQLTKAQLAAFSGFASR